MYTAAAAGDNFRCARLKWIPLKERVEIRVILHDELVIRQNDGRGCEVVIYIVHLIHSTLLISGEQGAMRPHLNGIVAETQISVSHQIARESIPAFGARGESGPP